VSRSGRGNVFLDSALPLTKSLRQEIDALGQRTEALAINQENAGPLNTKSNGSDAKNRQIQTLMTDLSALLSRIDRETPFIQLAITASGETLSTSMPPTISPSRLLQASTLLTVGDTHHSQYPTQAVQIGPAFSLTLYMLFVGHASTTANGSAESTCQPDQESKRESAPTTTVYGLGEGDRKPLWQEIIHKARVRLCRAPQSFAGRDSGVVAGEIEPEFSYYLEIIEDLDDGRVHTDDEEAASFDGVARAGIRETISVDQLSKLFYTDSGKLLNISQDTEGGNRPVLLLKRDSSSMPSNSAAPATSGCKQREAIKDGQRASDSDSEDLDEQSLLDQQLGGNLVSNDEGLPTGKDLSLPKHPHKLFPKHLDPDWIAMEMFQMNEDTGQDSDRGTEAEEDINISEARAIRAKSTSGRPSIDSQLEAQIRGLSLRPTESASPSSKASAIDQMKILEKGSKEDGDFVTRSPFKAITTSLSLLEMLIRLASLQEFQQAPHLSIPDHILTFFLEQTSTTGLAGEAGARVRDEVRRKVGFDPYSDKPSETEN
jgi:hypothetical protein